MIAGINDTDVHADALADLLRGDHAHVNLIPMNQVAHTPWTGTPIPVIERFAGRPPRRRHRRPRSGLNRGTEIGAACGQLAAEHAGQPAPIVVQRRRERLVTESAAALRGERSHDPVPTGLEVLSVDSRRPSGVPDRRQHPRQRPGRAGRRDPSCRGGRPPTGSTWTSWTATSCPT